MDNVAKSEIVILDDPIVKNLAELASADKIPLDILWIISRLDSLSQFQLETYQLILNKIITSISSLSKDHQNNFWMQYFGILSRIYEKIPQNSFQKGFIEFHQSMIIKKVVMIKLNCSFKENLASLDWRILKNLKKCMKWLQFDISQFNMKILDDFILSGFQMQIQKARESLLLHDKHGFTDIYNFLDSILQTVYTLSTQVVTQAKILKGIDFGIFDQNDIDELPCSLILDEKGRLHTFKSQIKHEINIEKAESVYINYQSNEKSYEKRHSKEGSPPFTEDFMKDHISRIEEANPNENSTFIPFMTNTLRKFKRSEGHTSESDINFEAADKEDSNAEVDDKTEFIKKLQIELDYRNKTISELVQREQYLKTKLADQEARITFLDEGYQKKILDMMKVMEEMTQKLDMQNLITKKIEEQEKMINFFIFENAELKRNQGQIHIIEKSPSDDKKKSKMQDTGYSCMPYSNTNQTLKTEDNMAPIDEGPISKVIVDPPLESFREENMKNKTDCSII